MDSDQQLKFIHQLKQYSDVNVLILEDAVSNCEGALHLEFQWARARL